MDELARRANEEVGDHVGAKKMIVNWQGGKRIRRWAIIW